MSNVSKFYLTKFFMIKRNLLIWLCSFWLLFPMLTNAEWLDWKVVNNCLEMGNNLNNLLKNSSVIENQALPFDIEPIIDEWTSTDSSSSYVADYNEEEKTITLIMWPKEPKWTTVDFKYSKKIGIIKIPATFKNVKTRIYDNRYLIIFADHNDVNKKTETIVIFYNISDWKLTPEFYFTHTWKLIKVHDQDWKMYVVTNTPLVKSEVQSFIKKDWNLPSMFPVYTEWQKYGLNPEETVSVCRNFRYLLMPSNQMPSFWSIVVLNLNNLKNSKELVYMLWTISNIEFSEKFMYMTVPWDWESTIVQKFWLDPKINPQKSILIDWTVIQWWVLVSDMKVSFLLKKSSWKINQYSLVPFGDSFVQQGETAFLTNEDNFSEAETHWTTLFLRNKDKIVAVGDLVWWALTPHSAMQLPLKNHDYFQLSSSPLTLLDVVTEDSKLNFSVLEKDKPQGTFRKIARARYDWEWKVLWNASWNSKNRTLLLPVSILWNNSFEGLKVLQLTAKWAISEVMSRSYWSSSEIVSVGQLQDFAYAITDKLVDIFVSNNSIAKKVFKR